MAVPFKYEDAATLAMAIALTVSMNWRLCRPHAAKRFQLRFAIFVPLQAHTMTPLLFGLAFAIGALFGAVVMAAYVAYLVCRKLFG